MKSSKQEKRILCLLLALLLVAALAVPALAEDAPSGNRTVRVGFFAYPGYHELNDGIRSGYGYDFLMLLQRYTHLNYEFVGYENSWEEMQQMLLNGEIDMVTSARKTQEREKLFDFSEPIGTNSAQINVRMDDDRFSPGDFTALDGVYMGIIAGNSRNADLEKFAEEKGFSYYTRTFDTAEELERALRTREVDAVCSSSLRKPYREKTVAEFAPEDFYVIVKKGDTALLAEINYGIGQMNSNEGNWRDDLYYRHYRSSADSTLSFTRRERSYIMAVQRGEKHITVAARPDMEPYSYADGGRITGIIPDYFSHLMGIVGLPYRTLVAESAEQFEQWTESNLTDIIMDCRHDTSPSDEYDFGLLTDPYMQLTISRVTRKGFRGRNRVIALVDSEGRDYIGDSIADDVEYLNVPTREEAMQAVKDGRADVCYVYSYTAEKFIKADPDSSLQWEVLESPVFSEYIYVSPGTDHELCSILNKCIRTDTSGALEEYIRQYTSAAAPDLTLMQYLKLHPNIMLLVSIGLFVLLAIITFTSVRVRNQQLRSEQLEKEVENQTQLRQALDIANLEQERNEFFLSAFTAGKWSYDISADDEVIAAHYSEGTHRNVNRDSESGTAMGWLDYVHADDRERVRRGFMAAVYDHSGSTVYDETFRMLDSKGDIRWNRSAGKVVRRADGSGEFFGMNLDQTEQVREQEKHSRELETALEAAEAASRAKSDFLFNMSHDIRTPMNAITGFTDQAIRHMDDPAQLDSSLQKVKDSSAYLLRIINDILDMAKIESGKLELDERLHLNEQGKNTLLEVFGAEAARKGLDFTTSYDVRDRFIWIDENRTNQIVANLISNAIKYTPSGGRVHYSVRQLPSDREGWAKFDVSVSDTGCGMSPEFLSRVFDSFERDDSAKKSGAQGTGLGMAIVKKLVDAMGGTIDIQSEPGKGTTVSITTEHRIATPAETEAFLRENGGTAENKETGLEGRRALLVEDNELNREIAVDILEEEGIAVEEAEDGSIAVELLREKGPDYYDFVLMDIQMPIMNGYEATRAIRAMYPGASLPIVALSANAFAEDKAASVEAGMNDHVAKPINVKELLTTLVKYL